MFGPSVETMWCGTPRVSNQKAESLHSTSPLRGIVDGRTTSKAETRSVK